MLSGEIALMNNHYYYYSQKNKKNLCYTALVIPSPLRVLAVNERKLHGKCKIKSHSDMKHITYTCMSVAARNMIASLFRINSQNTIFYLPGITWNEISYYD